MSDKEKAMRRLQMYNFAVLEACMFLDTHPTDSAALDYLKKCNKQYEEALADYVSKFGPVSLRDIKDNATYWEWVKGPWPWEGEK